MRVSTGLALIGTALALTSACRKPTIYDPAREQHEAEAFVAGVNELFRGGRWAEVSTLFEPDPKCTTERCVAEALTRRSACASAVQGLIALDPKAVDLFHHGDGFSAAVTLSGAHPPCRFNIDVNRQDGTGPFRLPLVPAGPAAPAR